MVAGLFARHRENNILLRICKVLFCDVYYLVMCTFVMLTRGAHHMMNTTVNLFVYKSGQGCYFLTSISISIDFRNKTKWLV